MLNQKDLMRFLTGCVLCIMCMNQAFAVNKAESKQHVQATTTVSSQGFSYQLGPVPAFVDRKQDVPPIGQMTRDQGDMLVVLYDQQISLLGSVPDEYTHLETKPLTSSALQNASQVYITFNPAYQKLVLHNIRIWRDGKAINLTNSVKLDLMRRENNLDQNMYEGNVTAVAILPGTRVNDVIDLEYSISGSNPVFGKHFAEIYALSQAYPISHFRLSLVTPDNRVIKMQAPQGVAEKEIREKGTIRYVVEKDNLSPLIFEDNTPGWYQPRQFVQISEYQDWAQVGNWANDLFKVENVRSPEIEKQIQLWKDMNLSKEQLAVEVLRWVQSQIRYFGIELGANSHLPAPPNLTVERKFGDCKDKSLLTVTLLQALDIDAEPALVSLSLGREVKNMVPSPAPFDHVIVKVQIDGKTYWLDPTRAPQYGTLDKLGATDFGSVLVLGQKDYTQLQSAGYPSDFNSALQIVNKFKVTSYGLPAQLTSQITANSNMAEGFRSLHDTQSKAEFNKIFGGNILRFYPKSQSIGDVDFVDDKINNQVTVTARFSIDGLFKYEPGHVTSTLFAEEVLGWASLPQVSQRMMPYALPGHSRVIETDELEFPEAASIKLNKTNTTKAGEFWTFTSNADIQHQKFTQTWQLKANKEAVPAQKTSEFIAETGSIRDLMATSLKLPVGDLTDYDKQQVVNSLSRMERTYNHSRSGRVESEMKNIINVALTTRDIASGKLGDKQLAEAYEIRALAYDDQGEVQKAMEDIGAARKLDPDSVKYMLSEADILADDGQFGAAKQLYDLAIQRAKLLGTRFSVGDYLHVGQTLHYLGQNKKAEEMFGEALRLENDDGSVYAAIWKYLVSGSDVDPAALQSAMNSLQDHAWPYAVGEMLLGKITPAQLIDKAGSQDKGIQEDQYCEAYFYIGQKYLLANDKDGAKASFQKSADQEVMPFLEYDFSLYELGKKRMPKKEGFMGLF